MRSWLWQCRWRAANESENRIRKVLLPSKSQTRTAAMKSSNNYSTVSVIVSFAVIA
jgi:hypothetical protein